MRLATYERRIEKYNGYDAVLLEANEACVAKASAQLGAK
jgi:hypothetical protein